MKSLVLFFVFLTSILHAQPWQQKTDIPAPGRDDGLAFAVNGIGYVVTGNQGGFNESNRLWAYEPTSDTWTEKSSFPGTPRQYAGSFVLKGKAYVFCGYSSAGQALKDVWQYTPENDSWKQMKDFEGLPRWTFFHFSVDDFGFLGAGATPDSSVADCWKYNPDTDDWSPIKDYPGGRMREVVGFRIGNKCFAGCGLNVNPLTFSSTFYEYDYLTDSWSQIADFPGGARGYVGAQGLGLSAIVGGGWSQGGIFRTDFYQLSLDGKWTESTSAPIQGWRGMSTFTLNNAVYFLTGLYNDLSRTSHVFALELDNSYAPVLFPNPSEEDALLYFEPNRKVEIFDATGHLVLSTNTDQDGFLNLPQLSAGRYILKINRTETTEFVLHWLVR